MRNKDNILIWKLNRGAYFKFINPIMQKMEDSTTLTLDTIKILPGPLFYRHTVFYVIFTNVNVLPYILLFLCHC